MFQKLTTRELFNEFLRRLDYLIKLQVFVVLKGKNIILCINSEFPEKNRQSSVGLDVRMYSFTNQSHSDSDCSHEVFLV